jgi:hypothetical protein
MFIQGDLQAVFEALYAVGAVEPMMELDWHVLTEEMNQDPSHVQNLLTNLNSCGGSIEEIRKLLSQMDRKSVCYIAMEVAREFAEFQDRATLH